MGTPLYNTKAQARENRTMGMKTELRHLSQDFADSSRIGNLQIGLLSEILMISSSFLPFFFFFRSSLDFVGFSSREAGLIFVLFWEADCCCCCSVLSLSLKSQKRGEADYIQK